MKILFIYPNVTRQRSPQIGICMIAAVAYKLGNECDMYDLATIPIGKEFSYFQSKIKRFKPDLLAVSCRSNEWSFVSSLFKSIDVSKILKVFGGPHATVAPEEVIGIADVAILGEGEETFTELLKTLTNGGNITNIAGSWVKHGNKIIKNKMRNLILDLDELPFPYWKIFNDIHFNNSYIKESFKGAKIIGTFESSRGCPYFCTYCTNDYIRSLYKGKGKWHREKSIGRIVSEIKQFRSGYGLDGIYWIDEVLLTSVERLKEFRDLYKSEIGVPFIFMERPENMTEEKVSIIKEAGAQIVSIGIESGDENIRRNILKRYHSQKTIISAFQIAKKYGLTTHAFTMIGLPGENKQSIEETYRILRESQPDSVQTTVFYPLRGTKLFEQVIEEGLFNQGKFMPESYYGKSTLKFSENKKKEICRYQYFLPYYNSRLARFFLLIRCDYILRRYILFLKVCKIFRKVGFLPTIKIIWRKVFYNR
jgi:anaerobic magnesium-protoporphyrin IX monomethyl ester cyclase